MSRVDELKKSIEQVEKRVATEKQLIGLEAENLVGSVRASVRSPKVLVAVFAGAAGLGFLTLRRKRQLPERRHRERRGGKGAGTKQASALVSLWASLGTLRQIWKFAAPFLYRFQAERAARAGTATAPVPAAGVAPVPPSAVPAGARYRGNGAAHPGT